MRLIDALARSFAIGLLAAAGVGGALLWLNVSRPQGEPPRPVAAGKVQEAPPGEQHAAAPQPAASAETVEAVEPLPPARPTVSIGHQQGLHRVKDGLGLSASAALAVDQESGEVLFQKNADAVLPIASLTKLMTALVLSDARLPAGDTITVTDDDVDRERNSRSRLRVGTALTRSEALQLALMSSENRAAHALARSYPGGLDAFVEAMNAKARALGMKHTQFVDPTGLSASNRSTARDVAVLAAAAARDPLIRTYSTTPEHHAWFNGRALRYINSNRLVKNPQWSIQLQKTGYIVEAGRCVVMQARIDDRPRILVVLDAGGKRDYLADAERLRRHVALQDGEPPERQAQAPVPERQGQAPKRAAKG